MVSYLPFEFIAAVRFLREGLVQSFLIVFGVAVGVSVIVFMSALLDGVQAMTTFVNLLQAEPDIAKIPIMLDSSKPYLR